MRLVSFRELYLSQFFFSFPGFFSTIFFFAFPTKLPLLTGIQYDVVLVWSSHRDKPKAHGIAKVLCGIEQKQEPAQAIKKKNKKILWKTLLENTSTHFFFRRRLCDFPFVICCLLGFSSLICGANGPHTHSHIDWLIDTPTHGHPTTLTMIFYTQKWIQIQLSFNTAWSGTMYTRRWRWQLYYVCEGHIWW